jgi:hypothetical protein
MRQVSLVARLLPARIAARSGDNLRAVYHANANGMLPREGRSF